MLRQVAHIQHLALQVIPVNKRRAYTKFGYICLCQYAAYSNSLNLWFRKILRKIRKALNLKQNNYLLKSSKDKGSVKHPQIPQKYAQSVQQIIMFSFGWDNSTIILFII